MTRRNKVRLAVSWWKAIQSHEWHRERGARPEDADLADAYSFDAISQLFAESVMREAGVAAFLSEARIAPLTIVYEDFVLDYEGTVRRVLEHVGLDASAVAIAAPAYEKLADELSERWVQRFRHERQRGWQHRGW
jgi:LPS sulfotransferase NodH